jgi:RNA recognition motif-containing protein
VGGLGKDVNEADLYSAFANVGEIFEVRVRCVCVSCLVLSCRVVCHSPMSLLIWNLPRLQIRLMKDATTGESKGYAFVRFTSPKFAKLAVQQVDGAVLKGRKVGVVHSNDNQTLFLGHLDKDWRQDDLEQHLRDAKIKGVTTITLMKVLPSLHHRTHDTRTHARTHTTRHSGDLIAHDTNVISIAQDTTNMARNRGFAFVEFSSHEEAAKAHAKIMKPGFRLAGRVAASVRLFLRPHCSCVCVSCVRVSCVCHVCRCRREGGLGRTAERAE